MLRNEFKFLKQDEKLLYQIITNLPFENIDELQQNLNELMRLNFKKE